MTEQVPDALLPVTCQELVRTIASAIEAEPAGSRQVLRVPDGSEVGQRISIDATEKGGLLNRCRISILNVDTAPAGEAARIEYAHEKQGKFGVRQVYSIQSVRRQAGGLVLLENFLAESAETVREEDFKPIASEAYAQTALKSVKDWVLYRAWQLQEERRR